MTKLVIVRGLPGSGKSTYARSLQMAHYEADQFFELDWGEYKFDIKLIGPAHDWCYGNVVRALRTGHDTVVSNTFTQLWELDKYLAIPLLLDNVKVEVVEMKTQYESVHGIPEASFKRMADRWEELDTDLHSLISSFKQIVA